METNWKLNSYRRTAIYLACSFAALVALSTACDSGDTPADDLPPITWEPTEDINNDPQKNPEPGQSQFFSADASPGQRSNDNTNNGERSGSMNNAANDDMAAEPSAPAEGADGDSADPRTVEEGDIYRVVTGTDLLLNLNAYRGLQIIDFSDVSSPEIIGRVSVTGTPVEMYQVGDRVYVLLNNWHGYYGSRDDIEVDAYHGGVVMVIDIADKTAPFILGQAQVPGYIRTSRLTRGNNQEALFVAATNYNTTYLKSFSVSSAGKLDPKSELELGGWVSDIQATAERLLVARTNWQQHDNRSEVAVIDISDPQGEMVEGESVLVKGRVATQFNMHMHENMLRVVSGGGWSTNTNYLETFDATDIHNLVPLDSATFGNNEDLYATLFLEESAFFVTYRRVDPFHAFEIKDDGTVTEMSEYVISGWNDYFRAVFGDTRLIGIGKNDENSRNTMAVSLYDITDLTNPDPFIARQEVELDYSWSEAQWDHRAFSVLEKATNVLAPNGEEETGLVLLPFSGWNSDEGRYISAVQIFTFSDDTLTLRGTMEHGTQVRRSFIANRAENTTANISEAELSLYDTTDPDSPAELGRLALAPNYSDFWTFGNHGVRLQNQGNYYWWWNPYNSQEGDVFDLLEVVSLNDDPDSAPAIATVEVHTNSQIMRAGDLLVVIRVLPKDGSSTSEGPETEINIWNFSNPANPALDSSFTTTELKFDHGYYYDDYYHDGDWSPYWYGGAYSAVALDNALVFYFNTSQRELLGTTTYESIYPRHSGGHNCYHNGEYQQCTYLTGGINCQQLKRPDGTKDPKTCHGKIRECTRDTDGIVECTEIDPQTINVETYTYTQDTYRHWQSYNLQALDLTDSANPVLVDTLSMPTDEEAVALVGKDDTLYYSYKKPFVVPGDSRPYVQYFYKAIDFTSPDDPAEGSSVNVPGQLIAVDDNTVFTQDYLWGSTIVETAIAKLTVADDQATLNDVYRFIDQQVNSIELDELGNLLVSHRTSWHVNTTDGHGTVEPGGRPDVAVSDDADYGNGYCCDYGYGQEKQKLSILDASGDTFALLAETEIDTWASLRGVKVGRALFTVPGGLLVVNLDNAASPYAQAYFATQGWSQSLVLHGTDIFFAAGRYGVYRFDIDEFNLVSP